MKQENIELKKNIFILCYVCIFFFLKLLYLKKKNKVKLRKNNKKNNMNDKYVKNNVNMILLNFFFYN